MPIGFVCECDSAACMEPLVISTEEYCSLTKLGALVCPNHSVHANDEVLEKNERYWLVQVK